MGLFMFIEMNSAYAARSRKIERREREKQVERQVKIGYYDGVVSSCWSSMLMLWYFAQKNHQIRLFESLSGENRVVSKGLTRAKGNKGAC
jgi:hypothetical protein